MSDKKTILVIDDDIDFINTYSLILEKEGYKVLSAMSSKEGFEVLESENPDLIVLDIMMESADSGFEFAQEIKNSGKEIPIIMSSSIARASASMFDTASLNVKIILQKPIDIDSFKKTVAKYIK